MATTPLSLPDRAIIPRHCTHCDGLVRLHIRVRTKRPITRVWPCPCCGRKNDITGRWQFMTVVKDFDSTGPA